MSTKHIAYFDFLRGFAILMVVGIHTFPECSLNDSKDLLFIVLRQFLNCAVPIFLALSAFFLARKSFDSFENIRSFWKKQIPKVYIPCLIWSLPLFFWAINNGNNVLIEIVRLFICGYSIYYFIALIIQYYLLLPLLVSVDNLGARIFVVLSVVSISFYLYMGFHWPLILYAGPFWVWIMFFHQGIIMGKSDRNYPVLKLLILILVFIILQVIESSYIYKINGVGFGIKATAFLYSSFVLWLLFSKRIQSLYESRKNFFFTLIEYIGKLSFGIYLIHCYVISLIGKLVGLESWGIKWFITVVLTVTIIHIVKITLPFKFISKYLGFL